ncbi:AAA family ATPase [Candidatus Saccharibacteria bacterium]|nr:AAA family ATPase [Candidatus Saccharibacteria bacterium]
MKRVCIVGCPGAGKTTFATKLAQKIDLPLVHLDYYYHQKKYDYYNDKVAWNKKVQELVQKESWIIDGNYSSTFDIRFKRADTIIFLDFPRRVSFSRVLKRRIKLHGKKRKDMPEEWNEKIDWYFIKYVWKFKGDSRSRVITAIENNKGKQIIVFKSPKETKKYLSDL